MPQTKDCNRHVVLASRPRGAPTPANFRLEDGPVPVPTQGQVLLRTIYLSLDPYMRGRIGEPKPRETVVVAGATGAVGAVGAVVGQIAKLKGCRVVGIAGGETKCASAVTELGLDACIDHHADALSRRLADACPNGIDVYFENVGGAVFDAVLPLLRIGARVPVCGVRHRAPRRRACLPKRPRRSASAWVWYGPMREVGRGSHGPYLMAHNDELERGTRLLDRYAILDRVGEGGMSTIYRAHDERLDRVVCVKLLRTVLAGSGSSSGGRGVYQATYSHFLQEALALSRLQHPNTLRIYDFGYLESKTGDGSAPPPRELGEAGAGRPFQISEFLDAGNLETHVRQRGALSPEETSAIIERIAGAVAEAHEQKIIHRDIKPPNILFACIGEFLMPKLADFGIAHSDLKKRGGAGVPGHPDQTGSMSAVALFSPRWAAPEQLAGVTEGPYTDVYALALCTAYMLAGRPLFEGSDVRGTFGDRMRGDDLVKRTLDAMGITSPALDVLLRALTADARKRTPTPLAFFEELRGALGGTKMSALPPGTVPARNPPPPVTLTVELPSKLQGQAPPERAIPFAQQGRRAARVVDVHERLDVSMIGDSGAEIRVRITMLPSQDHTVRLNIKGLNCFVSKAGRPTPAITAQADGGTDFVDTAWRRVGKMGWSFGALTPAGRVFRMDDGEMMIPSSQGSHAVALYLGPDVLIMCRRV